MDQGPVVQNIDNLTTSLRRQFVKYMLTLSNPLLCFVEKNVRIFCAVQKILNFFQPFEKITVDL